VRDPQTPSARFGVAAVAIAGWSEASADGSLRDSGLRLVHTWATRGGVSREILTFDRVRGKVRPMARLPHQGIRGGFYHLVPGENITCGFPTERRLIAARDLLESQNSQEPAASCVEFAERLHQIADLDILERTHGIFDPLA
jgi:hypothetical protein